MIRLRFILPVTVLAAPLPAFAQIGSGAPDVAPVSGLTARAKPQLEDLWLSVDDYHPAVLRAEQEGRVGLLLDIGTDGRVSQCTILSSSGTKRLDEESCRLMKRRGHFLPARGRNGRPTPDRWNYSIDWKLPPPSMFVKRDDYTSCTDCGLGWTLSETINREDVFPLGGPSDWIRNEDYPPELRKRGTTTDVELTVGVNGRVAACRITEESSAPPSWGRRVCFLIRKRARFLPAHNAKDLRIPGKFSHFYYYWEPGWR